MIRHENPVHAGSPPLDEGAPHRSSPVTKIVLVMLLLAAIGGTYLLVRTRSRAAASAAATAASAAANRVIPVLTAPVEQRDVPVWLEGLGNVSAFYTVTVKPQVGGQIVNVAFKEGEHVKKGDLLMQIDPRPFAIALQSAQAALARDNATLKNGQVNADRYKTLADQKLIAVQQYTDQAAVVAQLDAQAQADQAQIASAQLNLTYARITSPIDGVTGVRLVDPGNLVQPSDTTGLVVVTQLDPIAVLFTLPQDDLPSITEGMADGPLTVEARSRDGDTTLAEGKLTVIDNQINQATSTVRLKAIFANPKQVLWPNQFVKARLHIATRKSAIVVPAAVIQHGPNGTFAYVVGPDMTAGMRPVTVAGLQGEEALVSKGLQPGETVVVEGQAQLRPGSRVATKPAAAAGPAAAGAPAASANPAGSTQQHGQAPAAPGSPEAPPREAPAAPGGKP
jgi:multidrug efflux system membrane fusion protein